MIKLFTHTDLDGIGCAVLARLAFGDKVDITYCNYDDINQQVKLYIDSPTACECHITDISIDLKLAERIDNKNMTIQLLDHHPTALELNQFNWCKVKIENENNIKTSGTELYYQWLIHEKCLEDRWEFRKLVELIRDYDTWRWSTQGEYGLISKQINDLFYIYGREKFIDWCIDKITKKFNADICIDKIKIKSETLFSEQDKIILLTKQKEIDEYIKKKNNEMFIHQLCNYTCGFVFAERFMSELGNTLCKMHPEIDMVAMIDIANLTVSCRTVKDNIDLGKDVAKQFGGGGHPKAAGFPIDNTIRYQLIKSAFHIN